jgi:hypothetical protein
MNALQNAMTNLAIAIPAGRLSEISETGRKMKEGYIMNNVLSKEQMAGFKSSLTQEYIEMDGAFQKAADTMMRAAKEHDLEKVSLYFYRLTESCVHCHLKYARQRFPDLGILKDDKQQQQ